MDIPRMMNTQNYTAAEKAIRLAINEVERSGASIHLTKAVIKLSEALSHVADHVDGEIEKKRGL